ncbi:MAG TPA: DUF4870 domain-containing protein [Desulfobacteraceae bacterium]|nr:DUF4870 domain-containing protein [Desulfobacteraceae bacterium]
MKIARVIGIVIILCSIVPLGIAGYWYAKTDGFLEKAVKTEATVVDVEKRKSSDGTMFYPVFSFVDEGGNEHKIYSTMGSYPPEYEPGDPVLIFYDPQNPEKIKLDCFVSLWLGPVILVVLGLIPVFMGVLIFFVGPIIVRAATSDTRKQSSAPSSEPGRQTVNQQGDNQDRTWAMFCHLTALSACIIPFGNIIGPLVIWLIKKDEIAIVDEHGKESLNFQISMSIYSIISFFLCFVFIGFLLLPAVLIVGLVFVIIATITAVRLTK